MKTFDTFCNKKKVKKSLRVWDRFETKLAGSIWVRIYPGKFVCSTIFFVYSNNVLLLDRHDVSIF